jgi:hypothetical protein
MFERGLLFKCGLEPQRFSRAVLYVAGGCFIGMPADIEDR